MTQTVSSSEAPEALSTPGADPASAGQAPLQTRVKRIGLAAVILSMGILCSRLLGYVREAVIAYQAGAGADTDAYNAAFMLPDLMNHFLAGGTLSITCIPLFAGYLAQNAPQKAERLFSLIATTMGGLLGAAIVGCFAFATPLAGLLFPGFDADQIAKTVEMTRIVLPGQFFHYLGGLMMAVLMARGQFLPSALAPLLYNLSIIVLGVVLGPFLLPFVFLHEKLRYRPVWGFRDADFRKYLFLTLPLMLGVSLTTVDEWVGRFIGSTMEAGSISWLNYARRLVLVPIAIVGQAAGQAALPYLSQLSARGEYDVAADTLHRTLKNVILLSMVLVGFFVVLAEPLVAIVYERGASTALDTEQTAQILRILSISIVFWTIQMVSVRAFYAAQNTLRPMVLTSVVTLASLPVYGALSHFFGLPGLAVASCVGMAMQASVIVVFYRRFNAHFGVMPIVRALARGLCLGIVAALGAEAAFRVADVLQYVLGFGTLWQILLQLSLGGLLGALCAGLLARFIIPDEFRGFVRKVRRKVLRRKS